MYIQLIDCKYLDGGDGKQIKMLTFRYWNSIQNYLDEKEPDCLIQVSNQDRLRIRHSTDQGQDVVFDMKALETALHQFRIHTNILKMSEETCRV